MIFGEAIYENTEEILKNKRRTLKEKLKTMTDKSDETATVRRDIKKINLLLGSLRRDMQVNDFMIVIRDGINELKHYFTEQELEQIAEERSAMRQAIADQSIKAKIYFSYNGMTSQIRQLTEDIKENDEVKTKRGNPKEPALYGDSKRKGVLINDEDVSDLSLDEVKQLIREQLGIEDGEIDKAKQSQFDFIMHRGAQVVYEYLTADLQNSVECQGYPLMTIAHSGTNLIHWKISKNGVSCVVENSSSAIVLETGNTMNPDATYLTKAGEITDKARDDDFKREIASTPPLISQRLEYNLSTKKTGDELYETSIINPSYSVSYHYGIDYSPSVDPGTSIFMNKVKGFLGQLFSWISRNLIGVPTQIEKALAYNSKNTHAPSKQSPPSNSRPEPPTFEPTVPKKGRGSPPTFEPSKPQEGREFPPTFEPSSPEENSTLTVASSKNKESDKIKPAEDRPPPPAWVPKIPKEKEEEAYTSNKDPKRPDKPRK